jgi:hypothetical protein
MMSFRVLSPVSGTQVSNIRRPFREQWPTPAVSYNPDSQISWNRLVGLGIAGLISVAGWSGTVLFVRYLLK